MSEAERTPLQRILAQAIVQSGKTRDSFDTQLRKVLDTTGKPLWDIERGKVKRPSPRVLRAIEGVLGLAPESLVDLVHPRDTAVPVRLSDHAPTRSASEGETASIISLDLSASMGPGTPIEDFVEANPVEFDIGLLREITSTPFNRLRVIRGIGDSMEPKFSNGDRFLVDTTVRALNRIDGYYWITLWGAHGLKRLRPAQGRKVEVISANPEYDPIVVDADELTIEGRAIWLARGL